MRRALARLLSGCPNPRKKRNATAIASAWGGGAPGRRPLFGDRRLLCSFPWGSRRPTSSNLLPPGPPLFIFGFIPACLSGVGLKGAGWTRTENDISTRTTQSRATRERGHMAAALTCLSRDTLAKLRIVRGNTTEGGVVEAIQQKPQGWEMWSKAQHTKWKKKRSKESRRN